MSESGGAAGFVEVGDVLIETVVTVMTEDETGESRVGFLEQAGFCFVHVQITRVFVESRRLNRGGIDVMYITRWIYHVQTLHWL